MKTVLFSVLSYVFISSSFAQSSFRVKVIDAESRENIEGAIVYIEEIPIPDKETDSNGFVFYQNVPEDRRVRIHVRKTGYQPQQREVVANQDIGPDNNLIMELEKVSGSPSIVLWGEVTDSEGNDIVGATVEINIVGQTYNFNTDISGNYRFQIDDELPNTASTFRIEVSHPDCNRHRSDETIPTTGYVNQDISLECTSTTSSNESSSLGIIVATTYDFNSFTIINSEPRVFDPTISKWAPCDGRNISGSRLQGNAPDLRGVFIRGLNQFLNDGNAGPINNDQLDPNGDRRAGNFQKDAFQDHQHGLNFDGNSSGGSNQFGVLDHPNVDRNFHTLDAITGRASTETRPKNVAVYYYIKIN